MPVMLSFSPVSVIRGRTGDIRTVGTADDVWKTLLDDWPSDEGDCFVSALITCIDVQNGECAPEEARLAFIAAAVEAGVPLLS